MAIHFTLSQCSLGFVLAAASPAGICSILLGDAPEMLVAELRERFPGAKRASPAHSEGIMTRVVRFIEAPWIALGLPLDMRGTAFQRRVWRALCEVPAGSTATYREIAARIGLQDGARCVGAACAANLIAVAIPCHRVVRSDGTLAGYRWGLERKRSLLGREQAG